MPCREPAAIQRTATNSDWSRQSGVLGVKFSKRTSNSGLRKEAGRSREGFDQKNGRFRKGVTLPCG